MSAAVRLIPSPPARVERRKTCAAPAAAAAPPPLGVDWKRVTSAWRSATGVEPSSRRKGSPADSAVALHYIALHYMRIKLALLEGEPGGLRGWRASGGGLSFRSGEDGRSVRGTPVRPTSSSSSSRSSSLTHLEMACVA